MAKKVRKDRVRRVQGDPTPDHNLGVCRATRWVRDYRRLPRRGVKLRLTCCRLRHSKYDGKHFDPRLLEIDLGEERQAVLKEWSMFADQGLEADGSDAAGCRLVGFEEEEEE